MIVVMVLAKAHLVFSQERQMKQYFYWFSISCHDHKFTNTSVEGFSSCSDTETLTRSLAIPGILIFPDNDWLNQFLQSITFISSLSQLFICLGLLDDV